MMLKHRVASMMAVLVALVLLAAACGSGQDATDGAAGSSGTGGAETDGGSAADDEPEDDEGEPGGADDAEAAFEPGPVRFLKAVPWDASTGAGFYTSVEEGYFEAMGITETDTLIGSGASTGVAALISGSADIGQTTPDALIKGIEQGADLVAVWPWLRPGGMFGLLVNSDAGISEPADLEGRTIGVISFESATYFATLLILDAAGLTEDDVEIVTIGCCATQYTALLNGEVDAAGTWDAQIQTIYATAEAEGEDAFREQLELFTADNMLNDMMASSRTTYEQNKELIARWLAGLHLGMQVQVEEPERALANAAKHLEDISEDDPGALDIVKLRAQSYVMGGGFDHELIHETLTAYYRLGLINSNPDALDLERIFPNDISERVAELVAEHGG